MADAQPFDLRQALLDNAAFGTPSVSQPAVPRTIPSVQPQPTIQKPQRRPRPMPHRAAKGAVPTRVFEPAPPLLKDRNFLTYQFGGIMASLVALEVVLIGLLYLNVFFSLTWLQSALSVSVSIGLLIQALVAISEQHLPRMKRFFYRVQLQELWKAMRWVVWPLLLLATLFDVYSTAAGLRIEVLQRMPHLPSHVMLNTIYTIVGGIIALIPEPLLVITSIALIRLFRQRQKATTAK